MLCGKLQCQPKSADVEMPQFPVIGTYRGKRIVTVYSSEGQISCIQGKQTFVGYIPLLK